MTASSTNTHTAQYPLRFSNYAVSLVTVLCLLNLPKGPNLLRVLHAMVFLSIEILHNPYIHTINSCGGDGIP